MKIKTNPSFLNITDASTYCCPFCNTPLQKEIKKWTEILLIECAYCRYQDRPFGIGSASLQHFPEGCNCKNKEMEEVDALFISCNHCSNPKCLTCKKDLEVGYKYEEKRLCNECEVKQKKLDFNNRWSSSSAQEKLNFYGIEKLRILAKRKNIKGYSKLKKNELVITLSQMVNKDDFPIKSSS